MSLLRILTTTICGTFTSICGKWQSKQNEPKAFVLDFSLSLDYDKEEGFRNLRVALYAHHNYVAVYTRETWDVIPVEDLDYDEEGCSYIKPGKHYSKGATPWQLVVSHDSCWGHGVEEVLRDKRLNTLNLVGDNFYELVKPILLGLPERN